MTEDGRAGGRSGRGRVGGWGRVCDIVGVVAYIGLLLGHRLRSGRAEVERRELSGGRRGKRARGRGVGRELVDDGVVLLLGDDGGVDKELELLQAAECQHWPSLVIFLRGRTVLMTLKDRLVMAVPKPSDMVLAGLSGVGWEMGRYVCRESGR